MLFVVTHETRVAGRERESSLQSLFEERMHSGVVFLSVERVAGHDDNAATVVRDYALFFPLLLLLPRCSAIIRHEPSRGQK